jgi:SAM-dependent methyltransferase
MESAGQDHVRLLAEQVSYYRARAPEYLEQGLDLPGGDELTGALDAFRPAGSVLELACGPAVWTGQLLRYATDVTAVDASPEMLALAAARVDDKRVRFVQADLFTWTPDRGYDVVFFGFWLSHVPLERSAGTSRSPPRPARSTGEQAAAVPALLAAESNRRNGPTSRSCERPEITWVCGVSCQQNMSCRPVT